MKKITLVIKAPSWSNKDADAFAEAIQQMLFDDAKATSNAPAFVASYKVEKAKKKAKRV